MSEEASIQIQSRRPAGVPLHAATQAVAFPPGAYRFSVRVAAPVIDGTAGAPFPALLVAAGPGTPPGAVEFLDGPTTIGRWLCSVGDTVIARVNGGGATLVLSSLRTATDTQAFDIKVEQLGASDAVAHTPGQRSPSLKLRFALHERGRGDVEYVDPQWAGSVGSGAWIEAMTIEPLETLTSADIEYKSLAANGFETPWLSDGALCGTKGADIPLIGFAVRLKPKAAAEYDCEYSAYFRSGVIVGPLRNGVPCRSRTAGDPLEAVQVALIKRTQAVAAPESPAVERAATARRPAKKAPGFGRFRDDETATPHASTTKTAGPQAATKSKEQAKKQTKKQTKAGAAGSRRR